jgi:hypothetical protein
VQPSGCKGTESPHRESHGLSAYPKKGGHSGRVSAAISTTPNPHMNHNEVEDGQCYVALCCR